jgi:hypothetical protein
MKLHEVAHGRSGDKGDKANIGIQVFESEDYPFIKWYLTEERIADIFSDHLARPAPESVDRFELDGIHALNFLLHDALGGGASESLRLDAQGKTMAALVLRQDVGAAYAKFVDGEDTGDRPTDHSTG